MNSTGVSGRTRGHADLLAGLIGALTLLLLLACEEEAPPPGLTPLPPHGLVLAFGDSLTHGNGAAPEESYPAVLARLIGRRVLREGRPGELSAAGLKRLPGLLDRFQPDLLILIHGGNDLLRRQDQKTTAANIAAMVAEARARGTEVLLVAVPLPGLTGPAEADVYRVVASELRVPLEAAALAEILDDPALKSDLIHPNARGYRILAERIAAALRKAGALP